MVFIPRLPSFNTEVQYSNYDPDTEGWLPWGELAGQIYTPQRGPDDEEGGNLYFVYPKEDNVLTGGAQRHDMDKGDTLKIEYPTGSGEFHLFNVEEVFPRWLGFPNEHLMAILRRLTAAQETERSGLGVPSATESQCFISPEPATGLISSADPSSGTVGVELMILSIVVKDSFGNQLAGFNCFSGPDDSTDLWYSPLTPDPQVSDDSSPTLWVIGRLTPGTVNFTVQVERSPGDYIVATGSPKTAAWS